MFRTALAVAALAASAPAAAAEVQQHDNDIVLNGDQVDNWLPDAIEIATRNRWSGEGMIGRNFRRTAPGTRQRKARQAERRRPKGRR